VANGSSDVRSAGESAAGRDLKTLWSAGAVGGADDEALLARFLLRRDEGGERAFRTLVERHGGMVLGVCRRALGDGHDAQDAAQAVFLVLARKGGSIRSRGSLAPWLYGVACRVAARARRRASARRQAEARTMTAVARPEILHARTGSVDDRDAVHGEVGRLPEKYRAPVVLCYLQGLTYEEAAERLGCPVGTVRVRLSRAREKLRPRLARRGFGPAPLALGPADFLARALGSTPDPPPSAGWVDATVRSARALVSGQAAAEVVSASALLLSQEVFRTMILSQLRLVGLAAAGLVFAAIGVSSLGGQEARPGAGGAGRSSRRAEQAAPAEPSLREQLAQRVLSAARRRLDAQRTYYEEGRITIDRYLDASRRVRDTERRVAATPQERLDASKAHVERVAEVLHRETSALEAGRGTIADLLEAVEALDVALLDLLDTGDPGADDLLKALEPRIEVLPERADDAIRRQRPARVPATDR
jgi:RNA polymerase sigma factor (sigma-70 family)